MNICHVQDKKIMDRTDDDDSTEGSTDEGSSREWGLQVSLAGLSVSLVARWPPAELLYAHFARVRLTAARAHAHAHLALSVDSMQWDNQVCVFEKYKHFNQCVNVTKYLKIF